MGIDECINQLELCFKEVFDAVPISEQRKRLSQSKERFDWSSLKSKKGSHSEFIETCRYYQMHDERPDACYTCVLILFSKIYQLMCLSSKQFCGG